MDDAPNKRHCDKPQPPEGYQQPKPPEGYEPKPPQGYEPKPPQGYEPKPPQGYEPKPPQGYEPKPPQGYEPKPPQGYEPKPPEGYEPKPPQGYEPKPPQGYEPKPPQGYEPKPPQGYEPKPPQGYEPKPPQGYEPKPPEGYEPKPPQGYEPKPPEGYEPKPPEGYGKPTPPTEYGEPTKPGYGEPPPPPPPRECGEPEKPADPCSDPNAPTPPETCDAQPFGDHIKKLEERSQKEDQDSPKGELAAYKKLSDEVWKAEKEYAKEYDSLLFQELASENFYEKLRTDLLNGKITDSERKRIAEIVYCAPNVEQLRKAWIEARDKLPGKQAAVADAQNKFSDQDDIYKAALTKYQTAQKALDALQAQSTKESNARNYRGAWFLNEFEMCPELETPPLPCKFNPWLEGIAAEQIRLGEILRKAKVELDQMTTDAQKKKKDYEDAKTKRRDNILKAIAADSFPTQMKPTSQTTPSQYQSSAA